MAKSSSNERGAAMVEFAFVLPVFMALILGMFTGGSAYSTKLSLNGAAREGGRYGATLPLASAPASCGGSGSSTNNWLHCVADATEQAATGDLAAGKPGRSICVAYVHPAGTVANDVTARLNVTATGVATTSASPCFADGLPNDIRRVQVAVTRTADLEALVLSRVLNLNARSITRFEREP